jgi:hypothetical protein
VSYTVLNDLKAYLGISGVGEDAILTAAINGAQAAIESYTLRRFEAAADTTHYLVNVDGGRLWLDDDLCQITSVTNGDGVLVASTNYNPAPRNRTPYYALDLKSTSTVAWDAITGEIAVVGRWAASTSAPAHVVQACLILAAYLYRRKDNALDGDRAIMTTGGTALPIAMPRDVRDLLIGEVRR